ITRSMAEAMAETERRRERQMDYNSEHGITPQTIRKKTENVLYDLHQETTVLAQAAEPGADYESDPKNVAQDVARLKREMRKAAELLEFETAARLRDRIRALEERYGVHTSKASRA
ncbi:MAG: excinuclease ABC subunit B, partial [Desulfovibrionales bacterium]|nr:excinuclease ABC subunit B [Desulfovibrionales bacterium]